MSLNTKYNARSRRGFTLVEVMISVALVLMLTYGVAQVFKMASNTVGVQQAVSNIVRDHRAAVTTLMDDFRNCVNDSPLFLISSQVAYDGPVTQAHSESLNGATVFRGFRAGFRNSQEEMASPSRASDFGFKDPAYMEVNGRPTVIEYNLYTDRTPRMDRLGFFARGLYRRQTASNTMQGGYSATASNEAYIWYGHTALPGVPALGSFPARGSPYANGFYMTLPQNQYAQDRILGRMAILFNPAATDPDPLGGTSFVAPLDWDSTAWLSQHDVTKTSMDMWRNSANTLYTAAGGFKTWYLAMDDDYRITASAAQKLWWANCQPVLERPINAQKLSQTAPCFIPHCTQFMVEYAGDFLAQDPATGFVTDAGQKMNAATGVITGGKTDGEIDYVLDTSGGPNNVVKRIRWYGLPRDINGDGKIQFNDVIPLADVMASGAGLGGAIAPWEQVLPNPRMSAMGNDYGRFQSAAALSPQKFKYVCAWHNDAPAMIRILMKFDDPAGRLQEGQWYEYILSR